MFIILSLDIAVTLIMSSCGHLSKLKPKALCKNCYLDLLVQTLPLIFYVYYFSLL